MLKENWRFISRIERLGDFAITILAFVCAYYFRDVAFSLNEKFGWGIPMTPNGLAHINEYYLVLVCALVAGTIFLNISGAYGSMRLVSPLQLFKLFSYTSLCVFIAISATSFLLNISLSRSFILIFCVFLTFFLTFERMLALRFLRYLRRRGLNFRNIIICGISEQAIRLAREIAKRPELGIRVRCFADLRSPMELPSGISAKFRQDLTEAGISTVGRIIFGAPAIANALEEYAIDEVIFTNVADSLGDVEEVMLICAEQGVRTTIAADLFSIAIAKSGISYFGQIPLIHYNTPPGDGWELSLKRIIDIILSALALIILAPLFIIIALLVKITSPGPVFFIQKRVGRNGHIFSMYKFRSMFIDAEERLKLLLEHNEMQGPAFKLKNDPRITALGKILRRHSLDELPQLWNVFIGDMSLVGPRPPVPNEVSAYERRYRRRLSMRPGLTCTWQVSGRNEISDFNSWVKLDLEYIDNWSLWNDICLILRTIPAVIFGTGAR